MLAGHWAVAGRAPVLPTCEESPVAGGRESGPATASRGPICPGQPRETRSTTWKAPCASQIRPISRNSQSTAFTPMSAAGWRGNGAFRVSAVSIRPGPRRADPVPPRSTAVGPISAGAAPPPPPKRGPSHPRGRTVDGNAQAEERRRVRHVERPEPATIGEDRRDQRDRHGPENSHAQQRPVPGREPEHGDEGRPVLVAAGAPVHGAAGIGHRKRGAGGVAGARGHRSAAPQASVRRVAQRPRSCVERVRHHKCESRRDRGDHAERQPREEEKHRRYRQEQEKPGEASVHDQGVSSMTRSTRRFFCRPSAVVLSATGRVMPNPSEVIRSAATCWDARKSCTACERRWDSSRL